MSQLSSHRRAFLGVTRYGVLADYSHLQIVGEEADIALQSAREIIDRDGVPEKNSLSVRPHYDPCTHGLQGVSFRRMETPFFLFPDHRLVNIKNHSVTTIDNSIAAFLGASDHERRAFRHNENKHRDAAWIAFYGAADYKYEAQRFEAARKILIQLRKNCCPKDLLLA